MERFDLSIGAFRHSIARAREMVRLFHGLTHLRQSATNDDALRAAYFQAVSSFDFFVHELVAVEAIYRFQNAIPTRNIALPMEVTIIGDFEARNSAVEQVLREQNSYKSFVDPQKLAEILSCFCSKPWDEIVSKHNEKFGGDLDRAYMTAQLRSIWQRRNKIAHEADINPALAGVSLWPIDAADTDITIQFVEQLGECLVDVIVLNF